VVEMALITPILLMLVLGTFQVGLAVLTATRLQHAAQQGATAGANESAVPQRCSTAESTAALVYDGPLRTQCSQPGNVVTLNVSDTVPLVSPFGPWTFSVTARAVTP
jgi:Flp pilus assembly protein TadG